jgi:LmbE family N-acetylglucosaminyl deacetylase
VFFHAHPDDEALLTSGTMARLASEGHRVVLVVATDGEAGLADPDGLGGRALAVVRRGETLASARLLGCERVEFLGYRDSGRTGGTAVPSVFCTADVEDVARRVATLLEDENAHALFIYDPVGGYGHPDHVQVHRVGSRAAQLARTAVVLEATVDRDLLLRALRWASRIPLLGLRVDAASFRDCYVPGDCVTHRVDVRQFARLKRASIAAHASQASGGAGTRTLGALRRLPFPLFRRVLGTEWYVKRGVPAGYRGDHPLAEPHWPGTTGCAAPSPKSVIA